jgi:FixJ family two-component response regulator
VEDQRVQLEEGNMSPSSVAVSEGYTATTSQAFGRAFRSSFVPISTPIVYVLDGDSHVRQSLERLVRREGWRCETFASAEEFLMSAHAAVPNCLVLDAYLPGVSALEIQKRVAIERPVTSIIFIADRVDLATTVKAIKAGAIELLVKPFAKDAMLTSIQEGLERSRFALSEETGMRVVRKCCASLSIRERQVMELLVSGLLNKQVAGELGITEHTVKVHRGRVMEKMQADSFAHLVTMAAQLGISPRKNPERDEPVHATFV